jgi:signal transduction histidine kinase/GAF domain-containing protein
LAAANARRWARDRTADDRRAPPVTAPSPLGTAADVLEHMAEAFVALDPDWRIVYMNREAERINAKPRDEAIGRTHWQEWPASIGTPIEAQYRRAMAERVPVTFDYHTRRPSADGDAEDIWLAIRAQPLPDGGLAIYYHDVTAPHLARERAKRLLDLTTALSTATTLADAARVLVERGIAATHAAGASLCLLTPDRAEFEIIHALGMPEASITEWRRFPCRPGRPLSDAVLTGAPVLLENLTAWEQRYPEMAPVMRATGHRAMAAVPVVTPAGVLAGLSLTWRNGHRFDAATRDFLATLGELCGQALERARLSEAERAARTAAEAAVARLEVQAAELAQALDQAQSLAQELELSSEQAQTAAVEAEIARSGAEQAQRRERVLARLGGVLADALPVVPTPARDRRERRDATLQRIAEVVVPDIADWCVIDLIEPGFSAEDVPRTGRRVAMTHADPAKRPLLRELAERYPPDPARPTLGRTALATHRPQLIVDVSDELLASVARDPLQASLVRALGMRSAIVIPLLARGTFHGVAVFSSAGRAFTEDDVGLAEEMGRRAALAIDNAQLLAEAERRRADLEAVLEVVPVGIGIARDPDCNDVRVNPAFASQLGILPGDNASKNEPSGASLPFRVMVDGRELAPSELPLQRAARERRTIDGMEVDIVHVDGRTTRLLEYAAPLLDETGAVRGAVGAFVDITERARLIEAERAARAAAEEASRAKTHLLSILSHELRTPVNSVLSHAQLIEMGLHGAVTDQQRDALRRIHRSAQHLTALITDLLNLARIEQGRVTYHLHDVNVAEALETLCGLLAPQAAEQQLALQVEPCDPALVARADADRLQQILLNLVGNAIKFTAPGGRITLRASGDDDRVSIAVQDTGRGIPADRIDAIFDRFVQVDPSLTRRAGGLGLGLSISRDLANGMQGDLVAESTPGVGSTFTVTLPRGGAG